MGGGLSHLSDLQGGETIQYSPAEAREWEKVVERELSVSVSGKRSRKTLRGKKRCMDSVC